MSTRSIERGTVFPGAVGDFGATAVPIYMDSDTEVLKVYDKTASLWRSVGQPSAVSVTASATLSLEEAARPILVNAAGGLTLTLPVAAGSGARFRIYIATSLSTGDFVINCAGSDKFYGGVFINDSGLTGTITANNTISVDWFPAVAGSSVTFTMTQANGAGLIGDWVEVTDIGALKWLVMGVEAGGVDVSGAGIWS